MKNYVEFSNKSRPKTKEGKMKKRHTFDKVNALYGGLELTLSAFISEILPLKPSKGKGLKILTPQLMILRLPIALAQVKAGNTFENLLNEIRKIIYSLYRAKELTKKLYNNIMSSIKL